MKKEEGESTLSQIQKEDVTAHRYVIFLDIMGFKDRVARNEHKDVFEQLSSLNRDITNIIGSTTDVQIAQFSDSIVLFSKGIESQSLETISKIACGIMLKAIENKIPLKGAIAKGEITCDTSKQLFFGQALIDAYLLEENIQYYGILAHHTVEEDICNLFIKEQSSEIKKLYSDIKAPLKSGKINHYELSWYLHDPQNQTIENIKEYLNRLRYSVSDSPRKYIDNTLEVIHLTTKASAN